MACAPELAWESARRTKPGTLHWLYYWVFGVSIARLTSKTQHDFRTPTTRNLCSVKQLLKIVLRFRCEVCCVVWSRRHARLCPAIHHAHAMVDGELAPGGRLHACPRSARTPRPAPVVDDRGSAQQVCSTSQPPSRGGPLPHICDGNHDYKNACLLQCRPKIVRQITGTSRSLPATVLY